MPFDPVSAASTPAASAATSTYASTPVRKPKQEYDSELFLELLVTQLRNQDPSASMETSEIVSQTTSLAMMEALNTMAGLVEDLTVTQQESFSLQMRTAAADLIGREVSYLDDDGAAHTGTATSVSYLDAVPTVTVDGVAVDLDKISGVPDTAA